MVLNMLGGSSGGSSKNADIHWYSPEICVGDPVMLVHSDCELKSPISTSDFSYSSNITSLVMLDVLNIKLTLDSVVVGDTVTFAGSRSAYRFQNGVASQLSVVVRQLSANDTYEPLIAAPYNRDVVSRMTVIRNNAYSDSGNDTATFSFTVPRIGIASADIASVAVNADSYITAGGLQISLNNRDSSVYYVWKEEGSCDSINFIKVRWKGASQYNASIDQEWEVVLLSNGDIIVRLIKLGSYSGIFSFNGSTFTITEAMPCCFYRKDYWGISWDQYQELYSYSHHHADAEYLYKTCLFSEYAAATEAGTCYVNNVGYDDNAYSLTLDSSFSWHTYSSMIISGNSWMDVGGSSENIKMHRRDAKMYYLYVGYFILSDLNNIKAICVSWRGASSYSVSIDRRWTLWLFENGDAMIYCNTVGLYTGTCTFYNQAYTATDDTFVSFYYDSSAAAYDIKYEQYILEHHIV